MSLALGVPLALLLVGALGSACGPKSAAEPPPATGGDVGKTLVEKKCSTCHGLDKVKAVRGDKAKWTEVVDAMVGKGLKVTDKEKAEIIASLAAEQPATQPL